MSLEGLIPEDWTPEKAELVVDGFYETAEAILAVYGFASRELWREREQLRDRGQKPDLG